jgi:hypothetical protein
MLKTSLRNDCHELKYSLLTFLSYSHKHYVLDFLINKVNLQLHHNFFNLQFCLHDFASSITKVFSFDRVIFSQADNFDNVINHCLLTIMVGAGNNNK